MDERRINTFRPEFRSAGDSAAPQIQGYASKFNKISRNLGGFTERVDPACFNESRSAGYPAVVCRYNHSDSALLGTIAGNTLSLDIDADGLAYLVTPPASRMDVVELVQRGDVSSSSFAFCVPENGGDDWEMSDFGQPLRTLLSVELRDVAPVVTPAYPDATAKMTSTGGALDSLARKFDASTEEIRTLAHDGQLAKLFKRSGIQPTRPSNLVDDIAARYRRQLEAKKTSPVEYF